MIVNETAIHKKTDKNLQVMHVYCFSVYIFVHVHANLSVYHEYVIILFLIMITF